MKSVPRPRCRQTRSWTCRLVTALLATALLGGANGCRETSTSGDDEAPTSAGAARPDGAASGASTIDGRGRSERVPAGDVLQCDHHAIVLVASVEGILDRAAVTNGNPPLLRLSVEETLKGSMAQGPAMAIWLPSPHDIDESAADSDSRLLNWRSKLNQPPPIGSRWILAGSSDGAVVRIATECRYRFSDEILASVRAALSAP